jgi:diacylglycerol kinase (ATP)
MNSDKFTLKARLASFKFAFQGLLSLLKNEHNSRIHLFAAFFALICGFIFRISIIEWVALVIVIGLVFLAELINTSIETMADLVNPDWDHQIRKTKDYAAAAVLISAFVSFATGLLIFIPKMLALLKK